MDEAEELDTRDEPLFRLEPFMERSDLLSVSSSLFCSSSLASSSTSSGLSCAGEDGERPGEDKEVEEEVAVVCKDVGVATWLAI